MIMLTTRQVNWLLCLLTWVVVAWSTHWLLEWLMGS